MNLAIDGYEANADVRVGVGRYAFELIDKIAAMAGEKDFPFERVTVYIPEKPRPHMPEENDKFRYRVAGPKPLWTFIGLPLALVRDGTADVVFTPTHYIPRFVRIPRVMAIMDVSYLLYPELFRREDLTKLVHWTEYSVRHSKQIVTISEFSKRAIIEQYKVPATRITVAYPALPETVTAGRTMSKSTKLQDLPENYILSVGTLQPRKNFVRLIEAFSTLSDRDVSLVIVGKKGWLYEEILNAPAAYNVADRVKFLDFVPDEALPGLYKNARCFVLASLYEGFGLPVLEAMAHGTPVVVSDTSSLPEIAGDAGIYVKPEDVGSIAAGLTAALTENAAARRARVDKGHKRVGEFTWDKAAEQVIRVLAGAAKKGDA